MSDRPKAGDVEIRHTEVATEGRKIRGIVPFNVESRDMGGWREVIEPTALRSAKIDNLIARIDHQGVPVARHPRTLEVEERSDGLHWAFTPPESRQDLVEAVQRGDLQAGSWQMVVAKDRWEGDLRCVEQISELRDVGPVSSPTYEAAAVEYRSRPTSTPADEREEKQSDMSDDNKAEERQEAPPEAEESSSSTPTDSTEAVSTSTGKLKVENRTAEPRPIEDRVSDELRSVKVGETRALSNSSASAISPPELNTFLFQKLRASSVALQSGIGVIQTDTQKVTWPKLSQDVAPAFYNEGATITPGDPSFTEITVTPQKLAHITVVSNEVLDDSDPPLFQTLTDHVSTTLGLKLDSSIYTGGTALPGITGMANLAGRQTGGTITTSGTAGVTSWPAIVSAVGLLRAANAPEPYAMVAGPAVYTALSRLQDTTSQPTQAPASQPVPLPSFHWTTQVSGTAFVYSPSQFQIVSRQDATVELDRSRLFNSDQSEIRGKVRAALLAPNPEAVVTLTAS